MRICLPCREGNKSERFEIAFRETAGICLHLCGDTCWNATTNIFMFSETIYGISVDAFMNII